MIKKKNIIINDKKSPGRRIFFQSLVTLTNKHILKPPKTKKNHNVNLFYLEKYKILREKISKKYAKIKKKNRQFFAVLTKNLLTHLKIERIQI